MNQFTHATQKIFNELKDRLFSQLQSDEELALSLSAEDSLFVRFRNSQVRQNTEVEQRVLTLTFQKKNRRLMQQLDLTGQLEVDFAVCKSLLERARQEVELLPEDATVAAFENNGSSEVFNNSDELNFKELLVLLGTTTEGTDFTGLLASGPQIEANANSLGQQHWFSTRSFVLDYSLFTVNENKENKAVKGTYADRNWSTQKFLENLSTSKNQLSLLKRPNQDVKPGEYRVYMAPAAVGELIGLLSGNGLSYNAYKKGACPLSRLAKGEESLSPKFTLRENFLLNLTTPFNKLGETPASQVSLIENGQLKQFLTSTRTASEYGVTSNYADVNSWGQEYLRSPELAPGELPEQNALKELGTGLFLGNLHYCNWSDLQSARVTGMTRYACFWVENGEILAPIRDMRFDESLYRAFGKNLISVTQEQHIDPSTDTYYSRSLGGKLLPGLLVDQFQFTL